MIRLLVFDFDGVLVDSNAVKQNAYREVLKEVPNGLPALAEAQKRFPEADRFGILKETFLLVKGPHANVEADVRRAARRYNTICEEFTATCAEISGVSSVLPELLDSYNLAINSDTPQTPLQRVVIKRGWNTWFSHVLGRPKTKEENFSSLFQAHHVSAQQTVFLGDRERDRKAAINTKCLFVGMKNAFNNFQRQPQYMVSDLKAFKELICSARFEVARV